MVLSKYQQSIKDTYLSMKDNLIVNACPGSGKTYTLKMLWESSSDSQKLAYLVFGKANADEAKEKLIRANPLSFVGTSHSFGARAVFEEYPKVKVQKNKVYYLIKDIYGPKFTRMRKGDLAQQDLKKLVDLAKAHASNDHAILKALQSDHDIMGYPGIINDASEIYDISLDDHKRIDFADMLLWPVVKHLELPHFDVALIDECQDQSQVQRMLMQSIAERYVFVGDKRQAIFGFRGADSCSMEKISEEYHCISLPLKLSYRCPKLIVSEAQAVFAEDIEALPEAPDGIVRDVARSNRLSEDYRRDRDTLIVCRNNAPIIEFAYQLLAQGVPVQIIGRDFGMNLINFIKRLEPDSLPDLQRKLDCWRSDEETLHHSNAEKMQGIADKYDTIIAFMSASTGLSVQNLYDGIEALFNAEYGVKLSTIHKAKGLEAQRVYLLDRSLIPSTYARSSLALEQEKNLLYVAITRSKHELGYLV